MATSKEESILWYHGALPAQKAEALLDFHGLKDGLFLVRVDRNKDLQLSMCHKGKKFHYPLQREPKRGVFYVAGCAINCKTLPELIRTLHNEKYITIKGTRIIPCILRVAIERRPPGGAGPPPLPAKGVAVVTVNDDPTYANVIQWGEDIDDHDYENDSAQQDPATPVAAAPEFYVNVPNANGEESTDHDYENFDLPAPPAAKGGSAPPPLPNAPKPLPRKRSDNVDSLADHDYENDPVDSGAAGGADYRVLSRVPPATAPRGGAAAAVPASVQAAVARSGPALPPRGRVPEGPSVAGLSLDANFLAESLPQLAREKACDQLTIAVKNIMRQQNKLHEPLSSPLFDGLFLLRLSSAPNRTNQIVLSFVFQGNVHHYEIGCPSTQGPYSITPPDGRVYGRQFKLFEDMLKFYKTNTDNGVMPCLLTQRVFL